MAGSGQFLQEHAPGEIYPRQVCQGLSDQRFVSDYYVEKLDRKIQEFFIADFIPDLRSAGHQKLRPRQDRNDIAFHDDGGVVGLDNLAISADPRNEDASFSGARFQFGHGPVEQIRAHHPVCANGQVLKS